MRALFFVLFFSCASSDRYQANKINIGESVNFRTQAVSETKDILKNELLQKELKFITNLNEVLVSYQNSEKCLPGIDHYLVKAHYAISDEEGKPVSRICEIKLSYGSCKGQGSSHQTKILSKKDCIDFN